MYNINRGSGEYSSQPGELQPEYFEFQETFGETGGGQYETAYQEATTYESPLSEEEIMELATEFLEITNEGELDRFLGRFIRRVGRTLGRVVRSPIGRAIGSFLKPIARAALPLAGRAIGGFFGGPVGSMVGGQLSNMAGQALGLELSGMSGEDRDFEVGKRVTRVLGIAAKRALQAPPRVNPINAARSAINQTLSQFAPGLLNVAAQMNPSQYAPPPPVAVPPMPPLGTPPPMDYPSGDTGFAPPMGGQQNGGTWIRQGNQIIVQGA
ncbi:MAG: hypothetical protein HZB59_11195 [Ignavibacteriales bacterium]|nr:hypothetical protein [Ignavibacteriales bacterium]